MLCSYSFASVCIIQDWPTWKTDRADIWQEQTSSSWSSGAPGLQLLPGVLCSSWWGAQVVVKTSAATTDRWQRLKIQIENHLSGSLIWWNNKHRVMWGWAPCSSLMRGGKKLSSKIGFVHKGGSFEEPPHCRSQVMPSQSHLSSSVIMRSQEEKKQKPIGPNWQDGTTLSGTCYAKLLKNRCFPRYFLPLDASEFPLNGQYIEEPTLKKSVFFAIPCLSYLGVSVSLLSRGHFPRLYTGFTGARGFFVPSNKL